MDNEQRRSERFAKTDADILRLVEQNKKDEEKAAYVNHLLSMLQRVTEDAIRKASKQKLDAAEAIARALRKIHDREQNKRDRSAKAYAEALGDVMSKREKIW